MTAAIEAILRSGVEAGAFPGAVALAMRGDETLFHVAVGRQGVVAPFERPVAPDTVYDLASVSKIYTLATALRILRARGISLDAPLQQFLSAFSPLITLRHLMQHASSLEINLQSLWQLPVEEWLLRLAEAPLVSRPGTLVRYRCTNFFLLGRALAVIEGVPLETLVRDWVLRPAELEATFAPADLDNVTPTESDGAGGFWHGIVHDEAARSFREQTGDFAGNAGVFATAADVAKFARLFCTPGFFAPADLAEIGAWPLREFGWWRVLGWQQNNPSYMSDRAPQDTWGHLGFTGPSLVVHPPTATILVILSNRVHPTRVTPDRLPWHRATAASVFEAVSR